MHAAHSVLLWLTVSSLALLAGCGTTSDDQPHQPNLVFGRTGQGPGEFSYPRAAAIDHERQRLYVVDKAARIQSFNLQGAYQFEWTMPAHDAGKPTGLGVGPDGSIYAADTHYARVVVFDPTGTEIARFGTRGQGPGQFIMPTDVAIAADGTIYVGEYGGNDRISRFTPDYEYELSFGGPDTGDAQLRRPQALLMDADDTLWVADSCNHRICHFSAAGELLATFGASGRQPGAFRFPYGLDWLSDGSLVICEYGSNRVQRFSTAGELLGTWGKAGRKIGELAYPWEVVVGHNDRIYIIDSGNNRVQAFDAAARAWHTP